MSDSTRLWTLDTNNVHNTKVVHVQYMSKGYTFFYQKKVYKKMSLKNSNSLRKSSENLKPQMPQKG